MGMNIKFIIVPDLAIARKCGSTEMLHHCQQQAGCLFHKKFTLCGTGILPVHKSTALGAPYRYQYDRDCSIKP